MCLRRDADGRLARQGPRTAPTSPAGAAVGGGGAGSSSSGGGVEGRAEMGSPAVSALSGARGSEERVGGENRVNAS
jgi:hypothetical protein